jgi:hypothetical protein
VRRNAFFVLLLAAAMAPAACRPCDGVTPCGYGPQHVAVQGRLLTTESGLPKEGAKMSLLIRYAGSTDSIETVTDEAGLFAFNGPAAGTPLRLSLVVAPPEKPAYVVESLECAPVTWQGDACILPPIVESPMLPIMRFQLRPEYPNPVVNAVVTFRRTGGTPLYGPALTPTLQTTTDAGGTALIFPDGVFAAGLAPVIGDLTVDLPAPYGKTVRHGYRVTATYRFGSRPLLPQAVGPSLAYLMVFTDSATGSPVPGVEVSYRRTGGIGARPDTFAMQSSDGGLAGFVISPLASGTIVGTLTIAAPGQAPPTAFPDMTVATFDADSAIVWGRWKVGATGILYRMPAYP